MSKRISFVLAHKELVKHFQSTTTKAAIVNNSNSTLCFSITNAHVHTQGGDPIVGAGNRGTEKATEVLGETAKETVDTAWDAAKKTAQLVSETTTAEADTNVVDTVEYRSTEDLRGQLGDGCDKIEL
ncbi:putative chilling-induced protein [Sesbania bispinosa]|nr:putative chilling-induced protein [Sesbania bispinosa]